jgi:PAS domain S-box-containing protein
MEPQRVITDNHEVNDSALLASLIEGSDAAILSMTPDGTIHSWNARAQQILGYSAFEAIGQSVLLIVPPALHDQAHEILARVRRGERIEHLETEQMAKDGGRIQVCVTISPIREAAGRIIGASAVARDLTQYKRVEQELYETHYRKDAFLAILGHELRNPLAPLANGALLLRRMMANNPDVERICDMFDRQISAMRRLLDDLLDVSRLNQGKIRFMRQPLDLQPLMQTAVEMCRATIERRHHRLTLDLPVQPLRVLGDATRLSQAIANLLGNAVKYTPEGGRIDIVAAQADEQVTLRLRDSGIGIDAALLPHIFELFFQGDQGAGRAPTGLGVGLALAHRIIQAHNGSIEAFSAGRGCGAEFVVTLPSLRDQTG